MKDLEIKITELTAAIKDLTTAITGANTEIKTLEKEIEEKEKVLNHDDLRDTIKIAVRANTENKAVISGILKNYGAMKVSDLPVEKISEVIANINKGSK